MAATEYDPLDQIAEQFDLIAGADTGTLSTDARTIEQAFRGDRATAFGRGKLLAEWVAEQDGIEAEAEYVGEAPDVDWTDAERHVVRIHINGGDAN